MADIFFPPELFYPALGNLTVPVDNMITPHAHPNADELVTCISGEGTVFLIFDGTNAGNAMGSSKIMREQFRPGDRVLLPRGTVHFFLNTGTVPLIVEPRFNNQDFDTITVTKTLDLLPANVKRAVGLAPANDLVTPYK